MRGGIDLGGTKIQAVVVDDAGSVQGEERVPTPTSGGPPDVAEAMAEALRTAARNAGLDSAELAGVGGGIILEGKPWVGRGGAGEIGHMVVKVGGARCPCGRRGCVEAYAGRKALEERARRRGEQGAKTDLFKIMEKRGRDPLTSGVWGRALEHDDKLAHKLIDQAVEALGAGVASALNVLHGEAGVVRGGARAG